MMRTYRCLDCGQVVAAFVLFEGSIPILTSQRAMDSQLQARRELHADRCPGKQKAGPPKPPLPSPKPVRARAIGWVWRRSEAR
jgi:hypothetical protein